ncbi:MAG: multicopper oxidase family protein [Bauldia sp.]|nr:multicopper oxidase family protein [Bauldia sp.]
MIDRRALLAGLAASAALGGAAGLVRLGSAPAYAEALAPPGEAASGRTVNATLVAAERPRALPCFGGVRLPMWTYSPSLPVPVIRLDHGDRLQARLVNRLPRPEEHTSIHWHGIRLPNDQDGVPYLVQPPVLPGESFDYAFTPPDTGTFFFHSHCNTTEQLGRGMVGVLIVDGDTTEPYDADEVVLLRDWRVNLEGGAFRPMVTLRGAGRAGSYGTVRSANGAVNPSIALPASADCRLRVINCDPTRVMDLRIEGAEACIAAVDGVAIPPVPFDGWQTGPAMRFDLVLRSPRSGRSASLVDVGGDERVELARFAGTGPDIRAGAFDPRPLRAARVPEPDLAAAEPLAFTFADDSGLALPEATTPPGFLGALCLSKASFWTINGQMWPEGGHEAPPPPLAELTLGRSYRAALTNRTLYDHPVHLHGHTFKVLGSDKTRLPVHYADTVLLRPEETVEVAFVADNPGDWMLHCHVLEHQETGMMAYLRVA